MVVRRGRRRRRGRRARGRANRRVIRRDRDSAADAWVAFPVLFGLGAVRVLGEFVVEFLPYLLPLAGLVLLGYVIVRALSGARDDDGLWRLGQRTPRRRRAAHRIARTYTVDTSPPATIEIDPAWPGRTRVRIPAPAALPMIGSARFVPPKGLRARRYELMRWEGVGREDAQRWAHLFEPQFRAMRTAAGRGGFSVTLNAAGVLIHLPFVVPREDGVELLERHTRLLSRVMAGIAEREERALGLSFIEVEQQHTADCSCCWTPVNAEAGEAVICAVCGGMQHTDCAEWAGGCGRFACSGELAPIESLDPLESSEHETAA